MIHYEKSNTSHPKKHLLHSISYNDPFLANDRTPTPIPTPSSKTTSSLLPIICRRFPLPPRVRSFDRPTLACDIPSFPPRTVRWTRRAPGSNSPWHSDPAPCWPRWRSRSPNRRPGPRVEHQCRRRQNWRVFFASILKKAVDWDGSTTTSGAR